MKHIMCCAATVRPLKILLVVAVLSAGTALFALEGKAPVARAIVKEPPRTLTFSLVNPTADQLKDRLVEVAPGLQMETGDYIVGSSLKTDPRVKRFFEKDFQSRWLKTPPVYSEQVTATGDRLIVDRVLSFETADPCAMPQDAAGNLSICFRAKNKGALRKAAMPLPADLKADLARIRAGLADAKKSGRRAADEVEGRLLSQADSIAVMGDNELFEFLLNRADTRKEIRLRSVVPFVTYPFGKVPKLSLRNNFSGGIPPSDSFKKGAGSPAAPTSSMSTARAPGRGTAAVQRPSINPSTLKNGANPQAPTEYPEPLTFPTVKTDTFEYLNGFTFGYHFTDVYEVTFTRATILTDRYYAQFSYDIRAGVGLRFPLEVTVKTEVTRVDAWNAPPGGVSYPARKLCNGVVAPAEARRCACAANATVSVAGKNGDLAFYERMGLQNQLFDGSEMVFNFGAWATLIINLPGTSFDVNQHVETPSINFNRQYTTPIGDASIQLANITISGFDLGFGIILGLPGLSGSATIDPGLIVSATHGEAEVRLKPVAAQFASSELERTLVLTTGAASSIFEVQQKPEAWWQPWGLSVGPLVYSMEFIITPTVTIVIALQLVEMWNWDFRIGPFPLTAFSASLGRFAFGPHDNTPSLREHIVSAR